MLCAFLQKRSNLFATASLQKSSQKRFKCFIYFVVLGSQQAEEEDVINNFPCETIKNERRKMSRAAGSEQLRSPVWTLSRPPTTPPAPPLSLTSVLCCYLWSSLKENEHTHTFIVRSWHLWFLKLLKKIQILPICLCLFRLKHPRPKKYLNVDFFLM